jgi:hypothetical protein
MNGIQTGLIMDTATLHATLNRAWRYSRPEVVAHFAATFGLHDHAAIELFDELKLFLVAAALSGDSTPPSARIAAAWSEFVQFSDLYDGFCQWVVGAPVPHRPNGGAKGHRPWPSALTEYFWKLPV